MNGAQNEAIACVQTRAFAGHDGRRIALLTQHGKERVIAPAPERALGCQLAVACVVNDDNPFAACMADAAHELTQVHAGVSGQVVGLEKRGRGRRGPRKRVNSRR